MAELVEQMVNEAFVAGPNARVAAFALPGYDIADGGGVAPGGNMERNGYVP